MYVFFIILLAVILTYFYIKTFSSLYISQSDTTKKYKYTVSFTLSSGEVHPMELYSDYKYTSENLIKHFVPKRKWLHIQEGGTGTHINPKDISSYHVHIEENVPLDKDA